MEFLVFIAIIFIVIISHFHNAKRIDALERALKDLKNRIKQEEHLSEEIPDSDQKDSPKIFFPNESPSFVEPKTTSTQGKLQPFFRFFQQNFLTIAGILTLVLGLGYFVKYAIDKNWINEEIRSLIGYAAGISIIISGIFLRKKLPVFSAIIAGGGFAVLYFTTTIIFREYHLLSQNVAFAVTIIITSAAIWLSYRQKNEILIFFALLGGFAAPMMISSSDSNFVFLFIYLSLLNMAMLLVAHFQNWKTIGWAAFFFTMLYFFSWMIRSPHEISIVFYLITYFIFAVFSLQDYFLKKNPRASVVLLYIMNTYSTVAGLFFIIKLKTNFPPFAAVLIFSLLNFILLRKSSKDERKSYSNLFRALAVALALCGFALFLKTYLVATLLSALCAVLFLLKLNFKEKIFNTVFIIILSSTFLSQYLTWLTYFDEKNLGVLYNRVFCTSIFISGSFFWQMLLSKKQKPEESKSLNLPSIISGAAYLLLYLSILFESFYHLSKTRTEILVTAATLYSLLYVAVMLLIVKYRNSALPEFLLYAFFAALFSHSIGSQIVYAILFKKLEFFWYCIYLLYVPIYLFIGLNVIAKQFSRFSSILKFIFNLSIVTVISTEIFNLMMMYSLPNWQEYKLLRNQFITAILPIVWMLLACIFILFGIKKDAFHRRFGILLFGITIVKLYLYDVWQMTHVSRIVAFIILGLMLLVSSFMFQRLKILIAKMVDKNAEIEEE